MFEKRLQTMVREGERVVRIVRAYPIVYWWPATMATLFSIAPFFLMVPLFRWGAWGIAGFFVSLAIGAVGWLRAVIVYSWNVCVITDRRIIDIDQRGLFDRTVSETTYGVIQDVSCRIRGPLQTLLKYGSVVIQTAGSVANIELRNIKDPERVQQLIIEQHRSFPSLPAAARADVPAAPEPS